MTTINLLPTPHPSSFNALEHENPGQQGTSDRFLSSAPASAHKARQAKRAEWSKLSLRQTWADDAFMRAHLRAAGLRIADNSEPATVARARSLLRRVGVKGTEIVASIGTAIPGYLTRNPSLPLWAAVALILEATGRFTPAASA